MTRKTLAAVAAAVIVAEAIAALVVAQSIPSDMALPTHWGCNGLPDSFGGKWEALLAPAAVTLVVSILFYFLPALEPRREGLQRSRGLFLWCWAALLLLGGMLELAVVASALSWPIDLPALIFTGVGLFFILTGNQLAKSRSMYLLGFRTPWTLANEDVWIKTHRLAGKLTVACGFLLILVAFLPLSLQLTAIVMRLVIAAICGIPLVYSFLLWRAQPSGDVPERQ